MISVEEENREKRNPEQSRKVSLVNRKSDENKKQLQQFFGLCNFYRGHVISCRQQTGPTRVVVGDVEVLTRGEFRAPSDRNGDPLCA
jgi:hypothetical protein